MSAGAGDQPKKAEPERCQRCGSTDTERKMLDAAGEVMGVGRGVPLKVELLWCKKCDDFQFTGRWSVASAESGNALQNARDPKGKSSVPPSMD